MIKLILLLLTSQNAFNAEEIIFKSKSCDTLTRQAEAIMDWSLKLDPLFSVELPECICEEEYCSMNYYSISPELAQAYHRENPLLSGPNCWNRSLVFANILPTLSYSTPQEMTFWMNSPLCTVRNIDETRRPGDIVAIRSYFESEIHGFTYLTDELSFSKNGFDKSSPYAYQSTPSIFEVYGVAKECWHIPETPDIGSSCYRARGIFYNCTSLEEYIDEHNYTPSNMALGSLAELASIGRKIETQLFNLNITDDEYYQELSTQIYSIKWFAIEMKANDNLNPHEFFLWRAINTRCNSLIEQVDMIRGQIKNL